MNKVSTKQKNRSPVRFVAWIVALALFSAGLLAGIVALFVENDKQKMRLENTYEQIAYELGDSMNNLETNLSKLMVSRSRAENIALTLDCYRQSETAVSALGRLPVNQLDVGGATKFLNQVSDFCKSYSHCLAHGRPGEKFEESVESLYVAARAVNARVSDFVALLGKDGYRITANLNPDAPHGESRDMEHNSVEYPELLYDGPFSDGQTERRFWALENLSDVTVEQAADVLRDALPSLNLSDIRSLGTSLGSAPAYELAADADGGGQATFSVSVKGGRVLNMTLSRVVGKPLLNEESARQCARQIAAQFGYDVRPVWYNEQDGVAYVNLAPVKDDIVYYTDLVKVKLALDNGGVLGLEATGYCMNHHERQENAVLTAQQAEALVWPDLSVESARLCVAPVPSGETLCWEIAASYKGLDYFFYFDAKSGDQVRILRVVDEGQGKLTI